MTKSFEPGTVVTFVGSKTIPDGTMATICFSAPDYAGERVWAVDEEFENQYGCMSNLCLERIMRHVEDDGKEICTSWEDIKSTIGWVPSMPRETA